MRLGIPLSIGRFKVYRKIFTVRPSPYVIPPAASFMAAYVSGMGVKGISLTYACNCLAAESRIAYIVKGDPRVTRFHSYVFIGDSNIFKERLSTYTILMPPSDATSERISTMIGRLSANAVRFPRVVVIISQSAVTSSMDVLRAALSMKPPWEPRGVDIVIPPPYIPKLLGDALSYDDIRLVIDGREVEYGEDEKAVPDVEWSALIADSDLVTFMYVANPLRLNSLMESLKYVHIPIGKVVGDGEEEGGK